MNDFAFADMTQADGLKWHGQALLFDGVVIGMCVKGDFGFRINYREFSVSAGEMFVSLPKHLFSIVDCSADVSVKFLILSADFLYSLPISFGFDWLKSTDSAPCFTPSGNKLDELTALYDILRRYDSGDALSRQTRNALMLSFILILISMIEELQPSDSGRLTLSRQEKLTRRFFDLMLQHYESERTVSFYADRLCVTPKGLSSAIKNTTNHTTQEWINEAVLVDAKRCLKATDLTVLQISEKLHFSTASAFVRFFRQHTGYTPLEYRRM